MREIQIRPVHNGYMLQVGCQTIVFEDGETMLQELRNYLRDPVGTEHRFIEAARNNTGKGRLLNSPLLDGAGLGGDARALPRTLNEALVSTPTERPGYARGVAEVGGPVGSSCGTGVGR